MTHIPSGVETPWRPSPHYRGGVDTPSKRGLHTQHRPSSSTGCVGSSHPATHTQSGWNATSSNTTLPAEGHNRGAN
jgi:hypothetical protein